MAKAKSEEVIECNVRTTTEKRKDEIKTHIDLRKHQNNVLA